LGDVSNTADVVLVQMGYHCLRHVTGPVAQAREPRRDGLVLCDVELGQPAVQDPGGAAGEVFGVGDRLAVLARVEEHDPIGLLDYVHVDGTR
jgi:hypothetical protein